MEKEELKAGDVGDDIREKVVGRTYVSLRDRLILRGQAGLQDYTRILDIESDVRDIIASIYEPTVVDVEYHPWPK